MSALPLTNSPFVAPPDWRRLVGIAEAAKMLEIDAGHLRRDCRTKLLGQGMAYYGKSPEGGQEQWYVSLDYDNRLLAGPIGPAWAEPDLTVYTQKQREQALQRRACVEIWNTARVNWNGSLAQIFQRVLPALREKFPSLKISRSRLYEWTSLFRRPVDTLKLIDTRGGNQRGKSSDAAWKAFADLYLHENQPSIRACWAEVDRLSKMNGWTWCGLSACSSQVDVRITIEQQTFHRRPEVWRTQLAPFIPQDTEAWRAGEVWIADHKQLDVICMFGAEKIRPWLTSWMDWRTRRIVGWVLSDNPNSTTILAALRHGMMEESNFGGPRRVWIDNGKDFSAWVFHGQTKKQRRQKIEVAVDPAATFGIFKSLNIEAHFATPYNANGKARLERWFRTLESLCKTFETYTGDSIETRPDRLAEILSLPRKIPAFSIVRDRLADYIAGHNRQSDHDMEDLAENGIKLSPDEAFSRWCDTRRILADPNSLDLLLAKWHRPVSVTRRGVTINVLGRPLSYGQFETALSPYKALRRQDRKPVLVAYDPHDLRTIRIHNGAFQFICTARMNQVGGAHGDAISEAHVGELNKQKARYKKALKHVSDSGITSVLTSEEHLSQIAAEAKAKPPTPPDHEPNMQMVQTPMDGQSREVDRERFHRKAAGSESVAFPTIENPLEVLRQRQSRGESAGIEVIEDPFEKLRERNAW